MDVLLNGRLVPYEAAKVSLDDRGFQFSESVYEVICSYGGQPFEMERHMRRFRVSAEAIGLNLGSMLEELPGQATDLLRRSGLQEALIYIQATTGAAPRAHLRPGGLDPTVLVTVFPTPAIPERIPREGIKAITVSDERWSRCYVKTTMLMPNTLAKKRAVESGADDALFIRDGFLTEATAANVFAVFAGVLTTPPRSNYLLHGVTRAVILDLAAELGIPAVEGPVPASSLYQADELFLTGTASELTPVVTLDGRTLGAGRPGPVLGRLSEAYRRRTRGQ